MAWPTPSFGALSSPPPIALSRLDAMFAQVAAMVSIPCTATGSANAIILNPTGNAPPLAAYATANSFTFKAIGNSSAAVTVQFMALAALPLYFADGLTQVTTQLVSGRNYTVFFDAALNSGSGGYYLPMPQMPGNVGQVLTMQATGPAYVTLGGVSGGLVLLNTLTPSNDAFVADTVNITPTYSQYMIEASNVVPIVNAVNFAVAITVDGGATWEAASYASAYYGVTAVSTFGVVSSTTELLLTGATNGVSNTAGIGLSGNYFFHNPGGAGNVKQLNGSVSFLSGVGAILGGNVAGYWGGAPTAINGVSFFFGSGNIASGEIRIYGIA